MAVQTVDNTNLAEFLEKGSVPAFVPPTEVKPGEVKPEIKAEDAAKAEVDAKADKDAPKGEDEDADLPERVRKVVNKKHREMKEAEEYAESQYRERKAADKRADALQAELEAERAKSRPAKEAAKEPKPDDFKTVAEYADAMVEFKLDKKLAEREEQRNRDAFVAEQTRIDTEFGKRIETARAEIDDYEDVVAKADRKVPDHIWHFMRESEAGPLLGYDFAKDPAVLDRLEKLSPIRALAELGKLESKALERLKGKAPSETTEPKPEPQKTLASISKAPAPIKPIEGNSEPVNLDLNRDMPYSEFKRLKKLKEQGRG